MGPRDCQPDRFNPRTPYGVRPCILSASRPDRRFQSTHSLRSATLALYAKGDMLPVSIHALLTECDRFRHPPADCSLKFQSTHSLRSATLLSASPCGDLLVSIHALLTECDFSFSFSSFLFKSFNPRTPYGVRLRPTLYIVTQQSKSYFAPTSLKRPSLHGYTF